MLVEDSLALLKPLLHKKHAKLNSALAQDAPSCTADVNQLKRVIVNVLLNSIEAIPDHGTLWISTKACGGRVEIAVRDDGGGIREEDLQRVFDPYFTTKSGGSGLGLPLSKMIIEQHDGSIRVQSRPGEGTVVTVSLPADPKGLADG